MDTPPAPNASDTNRSTNRQGIRELRASLADAVRRAGSGERIIITTGGRPTAQLAPLDTGASDLDGLIASGALVPPRRRSMFRAPEAVAVWAGVRIDQVLRELRG